jgi:hypothetical protein
MDLDEAEAAAIRLLQPRNHEFGRPCHRRSRPRLALIVRNQVQRMYEKSVPAFSGPPAAQRDGNSFLSVC